MAVDATLLWQQESTADPRTRHTDTLVISSDDSLLIELGPLLGEHYRVHAVDTPAGIANAVDIARWIGILDVDSQADARSAISSLEVQHPACPLIVISARPEDWIASTDSESVLATIGRDQLATAHLSEALRVAEDRLRVDELGRLAATPSAIPDRFDVRSLRRRPGWTSAVIVLVVLAANGFWLYRWLAPALGSVVNRVSGSAEANNAEGGRTARAGDGGFAKTSPALPLADSRSLASAKLAAADHVTARPQDVTELLSAARVAFRDQQLLPPRHDGESRADSALELYVRVLGEDPANDEALDGIRRLLPIGRDRIMADVASGEIDDANRLLGAFRAAGVKAADLQPLASAVSAAQPKWLAQRAARNIAAGDFQTAEQLIAAAIASGADPTTIRALRSQEAARKLEMQLSPMAAQVNDAVQAGRLLQPSVDNALSHLEVMRSIGYEHPLTLRAQQKVQTALVQAGEQATRAARFDVAQRDLNAAAELGGFALVSEARRQLQEAMAAASRVAVTIAGPPVQRDQATSAHAPAAPTSTPVSAPPSPPYINAQPMGGLAVTYPSNMNADGSVIVEFTLSANGKARDVTVVQSDLPDVFGRTAIRAVRRGHYSTFELVNGHPARARIKLRFIPPARGQST